MIRRILTLGTVVFAVLVPLFVGHALAAHASRFALYGLAAFIVAAGLGVTIVRGIGHSES